MRDEEKAQELNERLHEAILEGSLELPEIQEEFITYYKEEEDGRDKSSN